MTVSLGRGLVNWGCVMGGAMVPDANGAAALMKFSYRKARKYCGVSRIGEMGVFSACA